MATNFPSGLDTLTNPQPTDPLNAPSHSDQHININDAMEAVQTKVGVDGSAVVTSLDYLVKNASSVDPGHEHTLATGANDVTATASELNLLSGLTATASELNQLDGVTVGGSNPGDIVTVSGTVTLENKSLAGIVPFTNAGSVWNITEQSGIPGTPSSGEIYLDDGTNTASGNPGFRHYNGSTWEDLGGGTVSPLTTKGDVYTYDTGNARLPVGTDGYVLTANSATSTGLEWAVSAGSSPLTTKGDLFGYDTGNARIPVGTNGQVLMADSTDAQGVIWADVGSQALVENEVPSGTIDGSNDTFTLANTPVTNSLNLYQNGIRLKPTEDYTISGDTITFVTPPAVSDILLADYSTSTGIYSTGSTSFVYNETPTGTIDGSNAVFTTANDFVSNTTLVYLDGQLQNPGGSNDYTETDTNEITFNTAPVSGSILLISYQQTVSTVGNADTLDGFNANATPTANTIPVLDSNGLLPEAIGAYSASITRQALMNGNFEVWQRGFTFAVGSNIAIADRFRLNRSASVAGTVSRQAITGLNGSSYGMRVQRTSGGGAVSYSPYYSLESDDSVKLQGKYLTLSFWVRAGAGFSDGLTTALYYGTGSNEQNPLSFTGSTQIGNSGAVNPTGTWQQVVLASNSAVPSTATQVGIYMNIQYTGTAGSNDYVEIAQMQLSEGVNVLPFEFRSIGQEIRDCQRFYEKSYNYVDAPGTATSLGVAFEGRMPFTGTSYFHPNFKVTKISNPTITVYSESGSSGVIRNVSDGVDVAGSIALQSQNSFQLTFSGTDIKLYRGHFVADAQF